MLTEKFRVGGPSEVHMTGLLNLTITDIWSQILLHCGGLSYVHGMFSGIPGQYPLDASNPPPVVIRKNVSRHCHMSLGEKMVPGREAVF